jgi:predicted CXXCH cytochrome family protein
MTKPIADATVAGDFSAGAAFSQHGRSYRMEQKDGRYYISVSHGDRPPERYEVHYTLGSFRFQGYLSKLEDGRIYVLPAFWSQDARRWIDWRETTPVPDDGREDLRQIWNITCFNCHATNLSRNYDSGKMAFATTWTEMGIGCEACHGPGKPHVALMEEWNANPALAVKVDEYQGDRSALLRIFSARKSTRRQVFDTCAYCHGNKDNQFVGFVPGDVYEDYALPFLLSHEVPANDPQGDFWPDGRPSRFNRPQALMLSGCFEKSEITCTSCHNAHGSRNPHALKVPLARTNLLCTQCHKSSARTTAATVSFEGPGVTAHTHHQTGSPGSQCINCHMSDVNWRLLMRRRDHTFQAPVPEMTAKYGVPNACTECHDDKSPEWAIARMDEWYGDRARRERAMALADTMYAAASMDPGALPDLARLAVDRSYGATIRAAAVHFIERIVESSRQDGSAMTRGAARSQTSLEGQTTRTPVAPQRPVVAAADASTIVNPLLGAASDPEPLVRAHAVSALAAIGETRSLPAITARLIDPARVVRTRAAEALLEMGIARLEGPAGEALARVQDEVAERLRSFPDSLDDQLQLGFLEVQRHRQEPARQALEAALKLDPDNVRGRVWMGIVLARDARFDEAMALWKRVRKDRPDYPNIDRLIAEAERRQPGR